MDELIKALFANPTAGLVAGGLVAVGLLTLIGLHVIAFAQGREISLWPPEIGPRPKRDEPQDTMIANRPALSVSATAGETPIQKATATDRRAMVHTRGRGLAER